MEQSRDWTNIIIMAYFILSSMVIIPLFTVDKALFIVEVSIPIVVLLFLIKTSDDQLALMCIYFCSLTALDGYDCVKYCCLMRGLLFLTQCHYFKFNWNKEYNFLHINCLKSFLIQYNFPFINFIITSYYSIH